MVSNARLDLPEPERPVTTISLSRGSSTLMFRRLWTRAPCTAMVVRGAALGDALAVPRLVDRFAAVLDPTSVGRGRVLGETPAAARCGSARLVVIVSPKVRPERSVCQRCRRASEHSLVVTRRPDCRPSLDA